VPQGPIAGDANVGDDQKLSGLTGSVGHVVKATEAAVNIDADLAVCTRVGVGGTLINVCMK